MRLRGGDFVFVFSLGGVGSVGLLLGVLFGARHRYVDCGHSDLPLSDRVIAGTIDLLKTGSTRRFAAKPRIRRAARMRVHDAELRQEYQGKLDWPQMSPEERRLFLDSLNEPPRRIRLAAKPVRASKTRAHAAAARRKR